MNPGGNVINHSGGLVTVNLATIPKQNRDSQIGTTKEVYFQGKVTRFEGSCNGKGKGEMNIKTKKPKPTQRAGETMAQ